MVLAAFFISSQRKARMTTDNMNDLSKTLKQQRIMKGLTLEQLAGMSGVSSSHLGRIERGERFPSAGTLRKLAKPLSLAEDELFVLANYLSRQPPVTEGVTRNNVMGLDPYVAAILSQEPIEMQRTVIGILSILKSIAKKVE